MNRWMVRFRDKEGNSHDVEVCAESFFRAHRIAKMLEDGQDERFEIIHQIEQQPPYGDENE